MKDTCQITLSYLLQKSRFIGVSVHTGLLLTRSIHTLKSGKQQRCLYKVVISLLIFQCFKTCLVYKVQTSLASFFCIITSKSSQVSALLGRWFTTNLHKMEHLFKNPPFGPTGHEPGLVWTWPSLMWYLLSYEEILAWISSLWLSQLSQIKYPWKLFLPTVPAIAIFGNAVQY